METYKEKRKKALEKADRINAYNKYVEDTAIKTERTITKFWAKDISTEIQCKTYNLAFGRDSISVHNAGSIQSVITTLLEFIVELEKAVEELETIKDDGGLNNGRI